MVIDALLSKLAMEHNGLPRLPAHVMDVSSNPHTNDGTRANGAVTARQARLSRASMPKSAGASSPQRRITGASLARAFSITSEDTTGGDAKVTAPQEGFVHRRLDIHPSQQSARPSSTRTPPRKVSHCQSPNQVTISEQHNVLTCEPEAVHSENEHLRREISLLQQRLVEKIRGNSKILVSGGQFRASGPSHATSPAPTNCGQTCSNCASLRASVKRAREIAAQENRALTLRISQLERDESEAQVSRNHHEGEVSSLRHQLQQMAANDAATKEKLSRQHNELEQLREATERLTKENEILRSRPSAREIVPRAQEVKQKRTVETQTDDVLYLSASSHTTNDGDEDEGLRRKLQLVEDENAALQRSIVELRDQLSKMEVDRAQIEREYAVERQITQKQLAAAQAEVSSLRSENVGCRDRSSALKLELHTAQNTLVEIQRAHGEQRATWHQQLAASEERFALLHARQSDFDAFRAAVEYRIGELEGRLLTATEESKLQDDRARNALRESEEAEETLRVQATEMRKIKQQYEECLVERSRIDEVLKKAKIDCQVYLGELSALRKASDDLASRLTAAEAEIEARDQVHAQLRRSHSAALEKAMQSVVRLCVVAPTVNVHLTNSSGGAASVVACKSTLPHKQVRAVVEQDVLPLFATVFVQSQENCSPQGTALDPWLQTLLRDMQESLATHLQKLYSATTASPTD